MRARLVAWARGTLAGAAWGAAIALSQGAALTDGVRVGVMVWAPIVALSLRGPYAAAYESVA